MRKNLQRLRKEKGLTQIELAEMLGISASYIRQIESGARNPTIALAQQIAELFGCQTIDEIVRAS